jgi:hypothetical protein
VQNKSLVQEVSQKKCHKHIPKMKQRAIKSAFHGVFERRLHGAFDRMAQSQAPMSHLVTQTKAKMKATMKAKMKAKMSAELQVCSKVPSVVREDSAIRTFSTPPSAANSGVSPTSSFTATPEEFFSATKKECSKDNTGGRKRGAIEGESESNAKGAVNRK